MDYIFFTEEGDYEIGADLCVWLWSSRRVFAKCWEVILFVLGTSDSIFGMLLKTGNSPPVSVLLL